MNTINATEAMRILRVSMPTIRALLRDGTLKGFKRGKIIRISKHSVEELLSDDLSLEDIKAVRERRGRNS